MTYTINKNANKLIINDDDNTIIAVTITGLAVIKKLSFNKSNVVKINKTSISTVTVDMLVAALEYNDTAFYAVYNDITRLECHYGYTLTSSAFYNMFNDMPDNALVNFFNNASHTTRQIVIFDHCCTSHTAKMSGMISYSTCVNYNRYCLARMKKDKAVCKHCFAARQLAIYADQLNKLKRAHIIATRCHWRFVDIPVDMIAAGGYKYFRLESFGDINNIEQVGNYNTLAAALQHKDIRVTLWTKNPGIVQQYIDLGYPLSRNLTIGLSSLELNTPEIEKAHKYNFIRFVFTVYTDDYIKEHMININCGGRHCLSCLNCYEHARNAAGVLLINERLK